MTPLFLYNFWQLLKRTVFTIKWWKENWYLPWFFIVGLIVWILTGGRGSAVGLVKKTNEAKSSERNDVAEIEKKNDAAVSKLEKDSRLKKDIIRKETKDKLSEKENAIEEEQDAIKGDSEAINEALNEALDL